jgi:hypothetical protein
MPALLTSASMRGCAAAWLHRARTDSCCDTSTAREAAAPERLRRRGAPPRRGPTGDAAAGGDQALRDGEAQAGGAAGDDRVAALEIELVHIVMPPSAHRPGR